MIGEDFFLETDFAWNGWLIVTVATSRMGDGVSFIVVALVGRRWGDLVMGVGSVFDGSSVKVLFGLV